jgi:bifunctional non-homologous end joining protein LigD
MQPQASTTVDFPQPLPLRLEKRTLFAEVDGVEIKVTNLDKLYWAPEGYTKGDLLTYWFNIAPFALPYLEGRPLTLKRMPHGADGDFFYAKQAPTHTPPWIHTAPVTSRDGKTIDYLLATDRASLVWLANLGCIELHPWHSRVDDIAHPDYAFFDLDPMGDATFGMVRDVALLVRTVLEQLGLRGYPRTSGATGMQIYVPIERKHTASQVREWVGRVCRLINRADPERTTMEWSVDRRGSEVFLDHNMNTEGKNIAVTYSPRPERHASVATPVLWEEVEQAITPADFTIATIWDRLDEHGDLFTPVLAAGQDLDDAMRTLGMDPRAEERTEAHVVGRAGPTITPPARRTTKPAPQPQPPPAADVPTRLAEYDRKRDFGKTPEPAGRRKGSGGRTAPRFVLQHHLATRLHHDLRLERHGTAPSWALPKGLPDLKGIRHLAVQTEDHPVEYMSFEGEIPAGEYGGGPVRIWDEGTYELLEWTDRKVTFRLHGRRHHGEYHLFQTGRDDPSQWMVVRADDDEVAEVSDVPPPPPELHPMLATDGGKPFDDPDWLFEIKWDGVRAIATVVRPGAGSDGSTTLVSRNGNDITPAYPELAPLWERVLARNAVLDGEIVALDENGKPSFQRLQQRMHSRDLNAVARAAKRLPVTFVVFDILAVDGEPLCDEPLTRRLELLQELLVPGGPFVRSTAIPGDGTVMFEAARQQELEGLIAKRADSPYRPGKRSRDWRKLKIRRDVDAVIGGWLVGEGTRANRLGALLVGLYDEGVFRYIGRVGTGFDDAELERLGELLDTHARDTSPFDTIPVRTGRWVEPALVCHIEYGEVTDDNKLRHPSYKGILVDKDPRECLIEDLRHP